MKNKTLPISISQIVIAFLCAMALFSSCGGDDGRSVPTSIIGEWKFHNATGTILLNAPGASNSIDQLKGMTAGTTASYNADSTFITNNPNVPGGSENGKFSFRNGAVIHYDYSSGVFFWGGPLQLTANEFRARVTKEQMIPNLVMGGLTQSQAENLYTTYDVTYIFRRK